MAGGQTRRHACLGGALWVTCLHSDPVPDAGKPILWQEGEGEGVKREEHSQLAASYWTYFYPHLPPHSLLHTCTYRRTSSNIFAGTPAIFTSLRTHTHTTHPATPCGALRNIAPRWKTTYFPLPGCTVWFNTRPLCTHYAADLSPNALLCAFTHCWYFVIGSSRTGGILPWSLPWENLAYRHYCCLRTCCTTAAHCHTSAHHHTTQLHAHTTTPTHAPQGQWTRANLPVSYSTT